MKLTQVTAPSVEPVTASGIGQHLRLTDYSLEETYLDGLITAARQYVEQVLGRKLIYQTYDYFLNDFPGGDFIELPYPTLSGVDSVKYYDTDITEATFSSDDYVVDADSEPGRIVLKYGETWPTVQLHTSNPIHIRFSCGYGSAATDVPEGIIHAIKLLVADMYENREITIIGTISSTLKTVDRLLWPYRMWS